MKDRHMYHRRHGRTALLGSVGVVGLLLVSGCGSAGAKQPTADTASSETLAPVQTGVVKVSAVDNNFKADTVTVTAGTKVVWTNSGRNDHNVTPVDGGDFGVDTKDFKPGAGYTATFATPGTYTYYCTIHGTKERGMVGTIQVVAK